MSKINAPLKMLIKVILYLISGILFFLLECLFVLWIKSPGKADPITDSNGKFIRESISEIENIELGGQEQYVIIRGADTCKPVMLFLHGGPGFPETAFMKAKNRAIENDFIMVYWEQRGAGKSYSKNMSPGSMSVEQLVSDTRELSEYLIKRFNKRKIYLMGHSWGSFIGIRTASQYPELFHAYLGVGQLCCHYEGERCSLNWVKEQAVNQNDHNAVKSLSALSLPSIESDYRDWSKYLKVQRKYLTRFGGANTHKNTGMLSAIKMLLSAKEYTVRDKINFFSGSVFSLEQLWPEMIRINLFNDIGPMQIPVYIFQGIFDYQTPYPIALDFYKQLKAPKKDFFTFNNSAHSPLMEEVDRFNSIIREDVLSWSDVTY